MRKVELMKRKVHKGVWKKREDERKGGVERRGREETRGIERRMGKRGTEGSKISKKRK